MSFGAGFPVEAIAFEQYRYAGTLNEMTNSLQSLLASEIQVKCGVGRLASVENVSLKFELGELSSGAGLMTEVVQSDGKFALNFPHHPKGRISATIKCQ